MRFQLNKILWKMVINEEKNEVYHNICIELLKNEWRKFVSSLRQYLIIPIPDGELSSPWDEELKLCDSKIEDLEIYPNTDEQRYEIRLNDINESLSFCPNFKKIKINFLFNQKGIIKIKRSNRYYVRFKSKITTFYPQPKEVEVIITTSFLSNLTGFKKYLYRILSKGNKNWYLEQYSHHIIPGHGVITPMNKRINKNKNLEFVYIFKRKKVNVIDIGIEYPLPQFGIGIAIKGIKYFFLENDF